MEKNIISMEYTTIHVTYPVYDGQDQDGNPTYRHTIKCLDLMAAPLRDALHKVRDLYTGYYGQDGLAFYDFDPMIKMGLDRVEVDVLTVTFCEDGLPLHIDYDPVRDAFRSCGFVEQGQRFVLTLTSDI